MAIAWAETIKTEDRGFVERAAEACSRLGDEAVLLLVGSRAAGLHPMDDLDLWIIGDRRELSMAQQQEYTASGQVFVDRGKLDAHWTFYDKIDLARRLAEWPSEMMWVLSTAKFISGRRATQDELVTDFAQFPHKVAESKLKWLVGRYRLLLHPICKAARAGAAAGAFAMAGEAVATLAKVCCVAECRPWPYEKWLTTVAGQTRAGKTLMPFADRAVEAFIRNPAPLPGQHSIDWPPTRELKLALPAITSELATLGWQAPWVAEAWEAVSETFKRPAP